MIERSHITTRDDARRAEVTAHGNWVFFTGIQPGDLSGDAKAQVQGALDRLDELMGEAGVEASDIFTVHVWLKDMRYFAALNAVWNDWADAETPPARTCVSGELYRPDLLVELVVAAVRKPGA